MTDRRRTIPPSQLTFEPAIAEVTHGVCAISLWVTPQRSRYQRNQWYKGACWVCHRRLSRLGDRLTADQPLDQELAGAGLWTRNLGPLGHACAVALAHARLCFPGHVLTLIVENGPNQAVTTRPNGAPVGEPHQTTRPKRRTRKRS